MELPTLRSVRFEIYRRRRGAPRPRQLRRLDLERPSRVRPAMIDRSALVFALALTLISNALPGVSFAQEWEGQPDDAWSQPAASTRDDGLLAGWSLRAGVGFIDDPTAVLLNIEVPYAFDRWVSAGPMIQVGLDDNNTIVAPTANVTVTIPDAFGNIEPFAFVGIGFAYIEDDNKRNDNSSAGFLVDFGFGLELEVNQHLYLGSQMMFNFLPEETLGQEFFYSWQILGVRVAF